MNPNQFPEMNIFRCSTEPLPANCRGCCPCPGPAGPAGPQGEAATIQIGTVTTGAPGSQAEVTNSGTEQNAVLNFVIPSGEPGGSTAPQFLTAYSTPPQTGGAGTPLIFDRNGTSNGTAVTHETNSPDIQISQPGYYMVSFHGTFAPADGASFPLALLVYLEQNGSAVPGTGVQYIFETATDNANFAFTQIIAVNNVPTTLNVAAQGGTVTYSDVTITVNKIGDIS